MAKKKSKKSVSAGVLIVDDEKSLRDSLSLLLAENYKIHTAKNGREAVETIKTRPIDVVLLDVRLPEVDGIEVLRIIKNLDESIEVIMLTAVVTVKKAVQAIRLGAYDYITKPFDIDALQKQVANAVEKRSLRRENATLRKLIEEDYEYEKIVGKSNEIREVFKIIEEVAKSNATVMISGESGTGKELVARAIHNRSPRRDKLFVPINCAAIPENLLESELFGHERGSFTGATERQIGKFEIANGGTIFLDEIGSLPLPMQAKLLRAIQEKEIERIGAGYPTPVDVRIISATNADLKNAIKHYKFRKDLYYRINVIPVQLPSLRERKIDIPLLAGHFLNKCNYKFAKKIKGFSRDALQRLLDYDWPGNVRELENLIERFVVLTRDPQIGIEHFPPEILGESIVEPISREMTLSEAVMRFESDFIKKALEKSGGKKGKAAEKLGIHRNTLINIEKKIQNNAQ